MSMPELLVALPFSTSKLLVCVIHAAGQLLSIPAALLSCMDRGPLEPLATVSSTRTSLLYALLRALWPLLVSMLMLNGGRRYTGLLEAALRLGCRSCPQMILAAASRTCRGHSNGCCRCCPPDRSDLGFIIPCLWFHISGRSSRGLRSCMDAVRQSRVAVCRMILLTWRS